MRMSSSKYYLNTRQNVQSQALICLSPKRFDFRTGTEHPPDGHFSCISWCNCLNFPQHHLWLRVHLVCISVSFKFMTLNLNCNENRFTRNDNELLDKRERTFPEIITGFISDLTLQTRIRVVIVLVFFSNPW